MPRGRDDEVADVRLAGFVHDLGRMAVPNGIWEKAVPLSDREWDRVRLHPYYTRRILERSEVLAPLAPLPHRTTNGWTARATTA